MTDEPRNVVSDRVRTGISRLRDREFVRGAARDLYTENFVRVDRRKLVALPTADARTFLDGFDVWFEMGDGRPFFVVEEVTAVRGERLAVIRIHIEFATGEVAGSHLIAVQSDRSFDKIERVVAFDDDDDDAARAELDKMHADIEALPT